MFRKYQVALWVFLLVFCSEIKPMDLSLFNFDFKETVFRLFQPGPSYSSITYENDGTSVMTFTLNKDKRENIIVFGHGKLYLHQVQKGAAEFVKIKAKTVDIKRFDVKCAEEESTTIIGPNRQNDETTYQCCVYVRDIPKLLLRNKICLTLASNIVSELLEFELRDCASIQESDKRIKTTALSLVMHGLAKVFGLQGVAVDQYLSLFDKTQCISHLKSNLVKIKANQRSKVCLHLPNDPMHSTIIKGELFGANLLQYSGNLQMNDLIRHSLSWVEQIKSVQK